MDAPGVVAAMTPQPPDGVERCDRPVLIGHDCHSFRKLLRARESRDFAVPTGAVSSWAARCSLMPSYGTTLLLSVYGTSMMISLPAAEQFHNSVFLLAAGMLTLAILDRTPLTVDAVLAKRGRRTEAQLSRCSR